MSEFRRRLMMANASQGGGGDLPFDYVQDGLAFHLDGIDKGSDPTAWTDLIQGVKFTYHNCTINKNNIGFGGNTTKSYCNTKNTDKVVFSQLTSTIEVCTKCLMDDSAVNAIIFTTNRPNSIIAGLNAIKTRCLCISTSIFPTAIFKKAANRQYSFSATKSIKIANKENMVNDTSDNLSARPTYDAQIGCRGQESFYKGNIYSIRIYNRQLTEEEMLHNQQVDIDRFFGGVVPQ